MEKSLLCGNKKTAFVPINGTKAVASAVPPILTPEIESVRLRHAQQRVRPDNGRPDRLILLGRRKFLRRFAQPSRVHSSGGLRLHSHQRQLSVRGLPGLLLPVKGFCGCLICLHYRKTYARLQEFSLLFPRTRATMRKRLWRGCHAVWCVYADRAGGIYRKARV